MIRYFLAMLLAVPSFAQLQISLFDGTSEHSLTPVTDLGSATMGDATEFRFHARNNSNAGIALQSLALSGQGFTISDKPTLPYIVAPQNFVEFRLRLAPLAAGSYSATLAVNGASYIVIAASASAPVLSLASNPASVLTGGASIDFGRIQRLRSTSLSLRLANSGTAALVVKTITVMGDAFHGPNGIKLPANLAAGSVITFQISFDPKTAGPLNGSLTIDNRSFILTGTAFDAPLPQPQITITGVTTSGSQPKVSIKFASAPESSGSGTLTLDFQPSNTISPDDSAILFLATGSRKLSFQVIEGDSVASIGTQKEVVFQTGTTAGVITLTAQVGGFTVQTPVVVALAPVLVDTATALRRVSDLDVTITGFDNTRTAGKFNFTFYDRAGAMVGPGAIRVDATADFGRYFAISRVGGSFLMRASFPVTGDATQIGGVDVELVNVTGISRTARLNLQ